MSESTSERDFEKEARADGWVPKEDWKGAEDKWTEAQTFVERGEKISGILKGKIGRLEERIENLTSSNAEFKQYTDKQLDKERKSHKLEVERLEGERAQAITDGDGQAAVRVEREIRDLGEPQQPLDATAHNQMAQSWASENKWYATNQKLQGYADGIAERIVQQGYTGQAYFNELTRQVKETFPEDFSNPNKAKPNGVEVSGSQEITSKEKSWDSLPAADKATAERFIRDIPGMTKKSYLETYEWEEA